MEGKDMRHSWLLPLILLSACMMKAQTGPCTEAAIKQGDLPVADNAYFYMPPYGKPVTGQTGIQAANTKSFSDRTNMKRTWQDDRRIVVSDTGDIGLRSRLYARELRQQVRRAHRV